MWHSSGAQGVQLVRQRNTRGRLPGADGRSVSDCRVLLLAADAAAGGSGVIRVYQPNCH